MSDETQPKNESREAIAPAVEVVAVKEPYVAPTLRYLGSVRDLTFGSQAFNADGADGALV